MSLETIVMIVTIVTVRAWGCDDVTIMTVICKLILRRRRFPTFIVTRVVTKTGQSPLAPVPTLTVSDVNSGRPEVGG